MAAKGLEDRFAEGIPVDFDPKISDWFQDMYETFAEIVYEKEQLANNDMQVLAKKLDDMHKQGLIMKADADGRVRRNKTDTQLTNTITNTKPQSDSVLLKFATEVVLQLDRARSHTRPTQIVAIATAIAALQYTVFPILVCKFLLIFLGHVGFSYVSAEAVVTLFHWAEDEYLLTERQKPGSDLQTLAFTNEKHHIVPKALTLSTYGAHTEKFREKGFLKVYGLLTVIAQAIWFLFGSTGVPISPVLIGLFMWLQFQMSICNHVIQHLRDEDKPEIFRRLHNDVPDFLWKGSAGHRPHHENGSRNFAITFGALDYVWNLVVRCKEGDARKSEFKAYQQAAWTPELFVAYARLKHGDHTHGQNDFLLSEQVTKDAIERRSGVVVQRPAFYTAPRSELTKKEQEERDRARAPL